MKNELDRQTRKTKDAMIYLYYVKEQKEKNKNIQKLKDELANMQKENTWSFVSHSKLSRLCQIPKSQQDFE